MHYSIDTVVLEVQILHEDAKIPKKFRHTDAGYDIYSLEDKWLEPRSINQIRTGLKIACPPGYYYTVDGRSSLWQLGIIPNRGIIDSTYTGELIVSLVNFFDKRYKVNKHDRIAQLILHKQYEAQFLTVENFSKLYNQRGNKGFGSSGR